MYIEAMDKNYEINLNGFSRANHLEKEGIKYAKKRHQKIAVLLVIDWQDPNNHFELDKMEYYKKWYEFNEVMLNDGCSYQVKSVVKDKKTEMDKTGQNVNIDMYRITLSHFNY